MPEPTGAQRAWDNATPGGPLWMLRALARGADAIGAAVSGKYDVAPEVTGQVSDMDLARLGVTNRELSTRVMDLASLVAPRAMPTVAGRSLDLPPLPSGAKMTGMGPHGPVIDGLQGRYEEALDWLRLAKTGDAKGVLSHPELPDRQIDLIFGNKTYGTDHVDSGHPGMLDKLPEEWDGLRKASDSPNRTVLANDPLRAVVRKEFDGEPKDWLLTFYEKDQPGSKRTGGAAVSGPASPDRLIDGNVRPFLPVSNATPWFPVLPPLGAIAPRKDRRE